MIVIISAVISACLSALVMSYIALATPLGPWIEPVIVLCSLMFVRFVSNNNQKEIVVCTTAAGGVAGITAVAVAFSYPTLFFLDTRVFNDWLVSPFSFIATIVILILIASMLACALVSIVGRSLLNRADLSFPVGQMSYALSIAQERFSKGVQLCAGVVSALLFGVMHTFFSILPAYMHPFQGILVQAMGNFELVPLLCALGFVAGDLVCVPLALGACLKFLLMHGSQRIFFVGDMHPDIMIMAWSAGMVIYGAGYAIWRALIGLSRNQELHLYGMSWREQISLRIVMMIACLLACSIAFFAWFNFSMLAYLYVIAGTIICAYQLLLIGGNLGIAPLGRFATFVMLPALFLFGCTSLQVTIVATFVETCGGIAVDLMFGQKFAQRTQVAAGRLWRSQVIGVVVGAVTTGCIIWFLSVHIGLGSPHLMAQRSYMRALLIKAHDFNVPIMACGAVSAWCMQRLAINGTFVLSGLLMPFNGVLPLIVGGLISLGLTHRENYYPFWSGVFAASSLGLIFRNIMFP